MINLSIHLLNFIQKIYFIWNYFKALPLFNFLSLWLLSWKNVETRNYWILNNFEILKINKKKCMMKINPIKDVWLRGLVTICSSYWIISESTYKNFTDNSKYTDMFMAWDQPYPSQKLFLWNWLMNLSNECIAHPPLSWVSFHHTCLRTCFSFLVFI